jgi:signal peptidase I
MIRIFKVEGNSLYPYLKDGQKIICLKVFEFSQIALGDFIVFSKKPYGLMIKRVERVNNGMFFVQGTDPMSIDSRNFGFIERTDIKYKKWIQI